MVGKGFPIDLGLLGALVGGVAGYFAFAWMLKYDFYGLVLPGALVGLGCGLLARGHSRLRGVICGALALLAGLLSEWKERPFNADDSLVYFVKHLQDLTPVTLLMIGLGALLGFWWGKDAIWRTPGSPGGTKRSASPRDGDL